MGDIDYDALPRIPAVMLWPVGYYDGPIDGVAFTTDPDGRLVWFSLDGDDLAAEERRHLVYELSDSEARAEVTAHLAFEQYVGTHECRHIPDHLGRVHPRGVHTRFYDRYPPDAPRRGYADGRAPIGVLVPTTINRTGEPT